MRVRDLVLWPFVGLLRKFEAFGLPFPGVGRLVSLWWGIDHTTRVGIQFVFDYVEAKPRYTDFIRILYSPDRTVESLV